LDREDRNVSHQGSRAPAAPRHKEIIGFRRRRRHAARRRASPSEVAGCASGTLIEHWRAFSVLVRLGLASRSLGYNVATDCGSVLCGPKPRASIPRRRCGFRIGTTAGKSHAAEGTSIHTPPISLCRTARMDRKGVKPHHRRRRPTHDRPRPLHTVPAMRRSLAMLTFAACMSQIAGCSLGRGVDEVPGPVLCDPPALAAPPMGGLASGAVGAVEIYAGENPGRRAVTATSPV